MTTSSSQYNDRLCALLWSLWTELGASGWNAGNPDRAIDPEPLIIATAALSDLDPRLHDEAVDWCIRYGHFVSGARLRNLIARAPESVQHAYGEFAATVAAHSTLRWPGATHLRNYRPTGRSEIRDFSKGSLIVLRLRALFGVGARSEIVKIFLSRPEEAFIASALSTPAGYSKRNVADALESLCQGGLLESTSVHNQIHYRLKSQKELKQFVGLQPMDFPDWTLIFPLFIFLRDLIQQTELLAEPVREVEIKTALKNMVNIIRPARFPDPPSKTIGVGFWTNFFAWTLNLIGACLTPLFQNEGRHKAYTRGK